MSFDLSEKFDNSKLKFSLLSRILYKNLQIKLLCMVVLREKLNTHYHSSYNSLNTKMFRVIGVYVKFIYKTENVKWINPSYNCYYKLRIYK